MRLRLSYLPSPCLRAVGLALCLGVLAACGSAPITPSYPQKGPGKYDEVQNVPLGDSYKRESVFGDGGLVGSIGGGQGTDQQGGGGIAVNAYLWRASLDTMAFMPLSSADPFGGVIITDWYSMPETPNERFKVNVYIVSKALRADGIKVSVFREVKDSAGAWTAAEIDTATVTGLEDTILKRARELRMSARQ